MNNWFFSSVYVPVVAWMALISLAVVAYLFRLEILEFRRNRRLNAERERLGFRRA